MAAPLLRSSAALLLPMQHFLALVIRHQLAEIRCQRSRPARVSQRLGPSRAIHIILTMTIALLDADNAGSAPVPPLPLADEAPADILFHEST